MPIFWNWFLINIVLPLSPFLLRVFTSYVGDPQKVTFKDIAEIPEILFYSIFVCISALNINLNGKKGVFEYSLRTFLSIIIVLNFIVLGMVYSNNVGPKTFLFSIAISTVPVLISIFYKLNNLRN